MHTIPVDKIRFVKELYPRLKEDEETIQRYRDSIDALPPIATARETILVDGFHRWQAFIREGRKSIPAEDLGNLSDVEIFNESIRRNSTHGQQLSRADKENLAGRIWANVAHLPTRERIEHIAGMLSVSEDAVERWTKDARANEKAEMQRKAWDLWLDCYSEREIGDKIGIPQKTINDWLGERKSADAEIRSEPPESRQHFDVWNFAKTDGDAGDPDYFGHMPPQIVENLLWFFTDPGDIVFDPFAGGGTTHDVAKRMGRRIWTSDLVAKEGTRTIRQHDILSGWPKDAPARAKLILLDPPYFSQAAGEYPKHEHQLGDIGELSEFMAAWKSIVQCCAKHIEKDGFLTFIISPTQCKDGTVIDHAFQMGATCIAAGLSEVRRIIAPYNTQQATGQQVEWAREHKKLLKLYRDILIFNAQ